MLECLAAIQAGTFLPPGMGYLTIVDRVGGWRDFLALTPDALQDFEILMAAESMATKAQAIFNR